MHLCFPVPPQLIGLHLDCRICKKPESDITADVLLGESNALKGIRLRVFV